MALLEFLETNYRLHLHLENLSEEDKDMIENEISLVIQNIISFFQSLIKASVN